MEALVRTATGEVRDKQWLVDRIGVPMSAIKAFCDRWQVGEMALFGSVLRGDFGPDSDIDVLSFTEGISFDDFVRDRRTQLSVLKSVEIVGEAAAQVSEDMRRANPDIPWRDIVGMRHRPIHVYFDIDLPLVWDTVHHNRPDLITRLEPLVFTEPE